MNHNLSLALQPAVPRGPRLTEQGRLSWPVAHINQMKPRLQTWQAASPSVEATECIVSTRAGRGGARSYVHTLFYEMNENRLTFQT